MKPDVVVVGGGAAGLLAALAAARGGRRVLALEAAKDAGRKILVSGGGRCNVLPMEDAPRRFVSESPNRLVRRFLDRWPLSGQRLFFEELLGGKLREEPESRKLFPPSNRAKDVRDALRGALAASGGTLRAAAPVRDLVRAGEGFAVRLDGEAIAAPRVILATGGLSVLAGGADAAGYAWAAAMGHTVRATYPALVPLLGDAPTHHALAGVSFPARVTARSEKEHATSSGGFLFTHKGWSGPSVLDVSHVVARAALAGVSAEIRVCFGLGEEQRGREGEEEISADGPVRRAGGSQRGDAAAQWDAAIREAGASGGSLSLSSFLRKSPSSLPSLPDRLASLILETAQVPDIQLSHLSREARARVVETLAAFPLPATGTEGYRTAEVTGGGVALEEVDPGSGKSRLVPGLFLAGEILDAFGPIGGFNFQWAWATGRTAGESAARG